MTSRVVPESPAAVAQLAQRGRFAEALAMGERLLRTTRADPRIDHLVGVIACQAGAPQRGAELLGRALARTPGDGDVRFNYARALADCGRLDEALKVAAGAAGDARLGRLEADLLKRAGNAQAAEARYRARVAAAPGDAEAWNNLGTTLLATDRTDEALAALEQAHRHRPADRAILRNLARALQVLGREEDALARLRQAFVLGERDPGVMLDMGQALTRLDRPQDALGVLAEAARANPGYPEVFVAIGLAYAAMAEFERAEQAYFFALQADPRHPPALLNLGMLLEQSNRIPALRELVAGAEQRGVGGDEMAMLRALVLRRDERFSEALAQVRAIRGDAVDPIAVAQTTAQLADRLGDSDLAFAGFAAMNAATALTPAARGFNGTEHRRWVEDMAATVTPAWHAGWTPAAVSPYPPAPVFLVGFPRSGTTLLDTALLGHSQTHVMEEEPALRRVGDEAGPVAGLAALSEERIAELRLRYFEEVARVAPTAGGKLLIDKLPLSMLRAPLIHRLFPDARFLFALRHPCDAVLSCYMQNFRINQAMASFLDIGNAARFFDAAMSFWTQACAVLPLAVHELRYEDLVEDREAALRPLLGFLDLPWEDAVLAHQQTAADRGYIRTPSYAQVTEPIYRRASGRWQRYRAQLEPVLDVLAPWAVRFGYGDPRAGQ
ncbi:MAG: sulfotransferase [Novosphingobium sp.]